MARCDAAQTWLGRRCKTRAKIPGDAVRKAWKGEGTPCEGTMTS